MPSVIQLFAVCSASDQSHHLTERLTNAEPGDINFALVAERAGTVVGAAKLTTEPAYVGTVSAMVAVAERERGRGIGTELATRLADEASRLDPALTVTCQLRDDLDFGRAFAERYGLSVNNHSVGWTQDVAGPAGELAARAEQARYTAQVRVREALLAEPELLACLRRTLEGLPMPFGAAIDVDHSSGLIPHDAIVIAAHPYEEPDRVCGATVLAPDGDPSRFHTVYTGVEPAYRGRGVGGAVKAAALVHAYDRGGRSVTTDNDDRNLAVLRMNEKLGMRRSAGYWGMVRRAGP